MAAVANSWLPDRGGTRDEGRGTGVLYEVCRSSDANIACLPQHGAESTKSV